MEQSFETRPLVDREILRALQKREDLPSLIRLGLQLGAFALAIVLVVYASSSPITAVPAALLLGAIWMTLFAPFHECAHLTAFRTRRFNTIGAWLTGIPFGMSPTVYREFHFAHHRYTHDPAKDPELLGSATFDGWPNAPLAWAYMVAGLWLLRLKVKLLFRMAFSSPKGTEFGAPFDDPSLGSTFVWESRAVASVWTATALLALVGAPGAAWIIFALVPCHMFQAIWLTAEHTGLPHDGTILNRTRTTYTSALVSWWLWNMNYHAEHHAWPAVPWHALPSLHGQIASHLEHESWGYWRLQLDVLHHNQMPDGARLAGSGK
ncbi:MAG TPA: fatty acid desaturase [Candidatus Binataceae bacterium]